ncbi:helicase associated domain-containing protein [Streptomyces sp. NRRL WC-3618]|uniref:helicase associated domain-containing protein n=1 Tax=Streptomyces sp. NRRL WC-3618 TaxID=1519490 RepID=UPI000A9DB150|nr:helicase associated domain-containing protein [Streptomyces sp. NRRL WC-3618]
MPAPHRTARARPTSRTFITATGLRLGNWVGTHQNNYRRGRISLERTKALEALPGWNWNGPRSWTN